MKNDRHLVSKGWSDYELIDSGENMKLERFGPPAGGVVVARPETQALWAKEKPDMWSLPAGSAHASFTFGDKKGSWKVERALPDPWHITHKQMVLALRLTPFKHTGIFPEQEPNWQWIVEQVRELKQPKILNLFGYTGAASIAGALAGAEVTHVDASKQSLDWAHENARLSGVGEDKVRWMLDDALAFVKREVRRGATYDGIILDPPAFGRGAKKEVWRIEEDLPKLLAALRALLSDKPGSFFLLSGYAAGYAPLSFVQAIESVFSSTELGASGLNGESGELRIQETGSERQIPAGIYVRFTR